MPGLSVRRVWMSALAGLALVLSHVAVAGELTDAVSANDPVRVNLLLSAGADVNEPSRFGAPIHIASGLGAVAIIDALIFASAGIEAEGRAGVHPLHVAATKKSCRRCYFADRTRRTGRFEGPLWLHTLDGGFGLSA